MADKVVEMKPKKKNTVSGYVTRKEFQQILQEQTDNVGIAINGCIDDINAMYQTQLFPFQMHYSALEKLLIDKGIVTEEEINEGIETYKKELLARAKEIQENEDGELEFKREETDEKTEDSSDASETESATTEE